ncbi:MAG: hypothetical protein P4N59_24810 [Negativicutes bacterium]|nr:hypothetical protein [Negativicutes bacterium]
MNILLVEPNYDNKYPPMGLMKLSNYHKGRGDYVYFYKGKYANSRLWDRIYITTLFTFDFDLTIDTINYYKSQVASPDDIFVGGIMASIMTEKLRQATELQNIISGRLLSSSMIGFQDDVNIDELPLDYDILYDTPFTYRAGDNFFGYTTRGCINKCRFCAVPRLEGKLQLTNHIYNQIETIRNKFGDKRNLLLLDNNILGLAVDELNTIVEDLNRAGFTRIPNYTKPFQTDILIEAYFRHLDDGRNPGQIIDQLRALLTKLQEKVRSRDNKLELEKALDNIGVLYVDEIECIIHNSALLRDIESKITRRPTLQRYIDFNQGMDARQLTEEKMMVLSRLPIRPFRIAYDSVEYTPIYEKALRLAHQYDAYEFSNYLLYNFEDKPEDLYHRMQVNISLSEEFGKHIYSFPMLYAPTDETNRNYIGIHWNVQYLRNVRAILNVSKGVFGGNRDFFEKAFGRNLDEYFKLLAMPKDLITYRKHYEDLGITAQWEKLYYDLNKHELQELLIHLSNISYNSSNPSLNKILPFYKIKYKNELKSGQKQKHLPSLSPGTVK